MARRKSRAQSTTEYAILISVVAAGILGTQIYFKRGVQAKIKNVFDHMAFETGGSANFTAVKQYEPYYNPNSNYTVARDDLLGPTTTVLGRSLGLGGLDCDPGIQAGDTTEEAIVPTGEICSA